MRYEYESGFDNFVLAQKTHWRSTPGKRVLRLLASWGLIANGAVILIAALMHVLDKSFIVLGCVVMAVPTANLALRRWSMKRVYRSFNGVPAQPLHVYLEIDGPLLVSGIQGKSEGRFQRAAICKVAEDGEMILLYVAKKRFLYLRKSSLPEQGLRELREWLALPGGGSGC